MVKFFVVLCSAFSIVSAAYGVYFAIVSLLGLKKSPIYPERQEKLHFAVLIPARNEENCIVGIIESIQKQDYPRDLIDIYVIPNNCTDRTAYVAEQCGAKILNVSGAVHSKGQALHEAFEQLLRTEHHDAYCVFDADNELSTSFLLEMNKALSHARVAKSRIFAKNPHESWVCGCYDIFFCNANLLLNRARQNIGLSARLIGTGFAVRRDLMVELGGWSTDTLTEDAEFYANLSVRGERIAFVPDAVTYDEEPLSFRQSMVQRRRWMSGIVEVAKRKSAGLLSSVLCHGGWCAFDCLLQLPFAFIQAWMIPMFLVDVLVNPSAALIGLPVSIAAFYCSTFTIGFASLLFEKRLTRKSLVALVLYPLFIFSFLPLQTLSLIVPNRQWKPIVHTGVRLRCREAGKE